MSEWVEQPLGDVCTTLRAGATPTVDNPSFYGGGIPFVTIEDISRAGRAIERTTRTLTEAGLAASAAWLVPEGHVLYSMYASLGKLTINSVPVATNQAILAIKAKSGILDQGLLFYALQLMAPRVASLAAQTTQANLSAERVRKFKISYPKPIAEQRRIAEVLSTLDEAIEQAEALIAKTQQIKAGLMHDLFTRGVTPDGQLRLPRDEAPQLYKESPLGWIPNEWQCGRLSDYLDFPNGIKPGPFGSSLTKDSYTSSGYRVYGQEQVIAGSLEVGDYYISKAKFAEMRPFEVIGGDVLLSLVGTIGRVLVAESPFQPGIINPRLMRLRPNLEKGSPYFLRYLLLAPGIRRQIDSLAGGGTMPVINGKIIRRLAAPAIEPMEQQRIVTRLDVSEQHISILNEDAAKLDQIKHGLMHDLLTGRVRVFKDVQLAEASL
jgi:type I restriction enzyme, S subunit